MPSNYLVLLNESLLSAVLAMPVPERRRFREKLEFLGAGLWDTGVRVKRLKGASRKVVFEARLNRRDRLLFTLGRDRGRPLVYLWDLVAHDEVARAARRVGASDAPFLSYEPEGTEDRPDLSLDDVGEEGWTQEPLEARVREDYGPQKWLVLDEAEWERLLRARPADDLALHLYLTREQERVLAMPPPLLLSGTVGSGKTTIGAYYLLRPGFRDGRRLFVTWSPFLRRFSERLYRALVLHTEHAPEGQEPEFLTLRELVSGLLGEAEAPVAGYREFERIYRAHAQARSCDAELVWEEIRSIIKGAKPVLSARRLKTLADAWIGGGASARDVGELQELLLELRKLKPFHRVVRLVPDYEEHVRGMTERAPGDADRRVLEHAVELAERRAAGLASPLLSLDEYLALGARRAPNFRYDRKTIYEIALHYQERLTAGGAQDDVDRARRALERLERGNVPLYDLVVCDEVQDLCELETTLLLRLAGSRGGVVLAGDLRQCINPSGFRWEEIRRAFYERGQTPPEVLDLSLNLRCVGSIVRLANALLALKARLVGLTSTERPEDWKFNGNPPLVLAGPAERDVLAAVDMKVAGRIVIVRTAEEKARVSTALGSELVFTIYEAKGLEFDTVLLWRFLGTPEAARLWRRVLAAGAVEPEHEPHLRHELSLIYVALTRARTGLVIYDGEVPCPLWEQESIRGLVFRSKDPVETGRFWRHTSTPGEWEEQAVYFEEREHWSAAEECYRNAGRIERAEVARARGLVAEGKPAEAAPLFARNSLLREAASSYEAAGDLERAMQVWEDLGEGEKYRRCRVRLYEERGEHAKAAEGWEELGSREDALRCWEAAGRWERVGSLWLDRKQYRKAAEAFARGGLAARAAPAWQKAREGLKAAQEYQRARMWDRAAGLYRKAGELDRALDCLRNIPDHRGVAELLEKRGEMAGAMQALRSLMAGKPEEGERLRREMQAAEAGRPTRRKCAAAAVRAAVLGEHARAAAHFEASGHLDLAVHEWTVAEEAVGVARVLAAQGKEADAARHLERHAPGERELIEAYLRRSIMVAGRADRARVNALWQEAERLERSGNLAEALSRFRLFGDKGRLEQIYLQLDRDEEALDRLLEGDDYMAAVRYQERKETLRVGAEYIARHVDQLAPLRNWIPPARLEFCARLVQHGLSCGVDVTVPGRRLLDSVPRYVGITGAAATSVEDLAIRFTHVKALLSLLGVDAIRLPWVRSPKGRGDREALLNRIRAAAEVRRDTVLEACWAVVLEPERFERLLGGFPVDTATVALFELSRDRHAAAVEFHLARGDLQSAESVHRGWDEWIEAAELQEKGGDATGACRTYRDRKEFRRALECAQRAGDVVEAARAYEGLKEYRMALDLWSSLSRKRDVLRVAKKLPPPEDRQPDLFRAADA